jgi:CBS domain containing-hemolysin-like protein
VTDVLLVLLSLALVVACGAFVAAEFSFVTVDRSTVERAAEGGDSGARGVLDALHSLSTQLSGAQLGITLTNLLIGFMAEPAIAKLIDGPLEDVGVPSGAVHGVAVVIALVLATGFTMVLGELVPKNLAIAAPLGTAKVVQRFMRGFTRVNRPVITLFNSAANAVLHRLGIEPQEELASARSPEELTSLVGRSAQQGTLAPDTATLLQRSIAFGDRRADDVMTPRTRMVALRDSDPVIKVIEEARATGFSRFPVIGRRADEVVGIVHVKHAVRVPPEQRAETPVSEVMVPAIVIPSSVELDPLLVTLREGGLQMAVVVDEFGGIDGVVTLEDVVEEIVGEVRDEHDRRDEAIEQESENRWLLSGLLRPDEVADATHIMLPESEDGDYETLAGLITERLGRVPRVGDAVELEVRDDEGRRRTAKLSVRRMDALRVDRVRLEVGPPEDDDEDEDDAS